MNHGTPDDGTLGATAELAAFMVGVEKRMLGAALVSPRLAELLATSLSPADFWSMRHATVFDAMQTLYRNSAPTNPIAVAEYLQERGLLDSIGVKTLYDMIQSAPTDHLDFPRIVGTMARCGAWQWS